MRTSPSLPSNFVPDRGPAKYFHGRKQILRDLGGILRYSTQNKWGTTFLIQGAPGVGKSALLEECEKHARENEWGVAKIGAESLWDPYELREDLGLGNKSEVTEKSTQFGVENLVKREIRTSRPRRTLLNILQADRQPLLLVLDEAQVLGEMDVPPSEYRATAIKVFNAIHNGELVRPVILVAAGLGTTKKAFQSLGISRFSGGCFVELGALSKESERAVIHDWLAKEGEAQGDPTEWIDAIAQETHGWPQHILSYVEPASRHLRAHDGAMTTEGLNTVLGAPG